MAEQAGARSSAKTIGLWLFLIVMFVAFWQFFSTDKAPLVSVAELRDRATQTGAVITATIDLEKGTGIGEVRSPQFGNWRTAETPLSEFIGLQVQGLPLVFREDKPPLLLSIFLQWLLPALLLYGVLWVLQRTNNRPLVPFDVEALSTDASLGQLQGLFAAREALQSAVRAARKGSDDVPKKILIVGPPGSGKTLLVKWLAADTKTHTEFVAGSRFVELYAGIGSHRIRTWIGALKKRKQPVIAAIDDVDAFAIRRSDTKKDDRNDERTGTLLALTDQLDGIEKFPPKLVFIATTSREDLLDEAFVRPGRFDLKITLQANREATLEQLKPVGAATPSVG